MTDNKSAEADTCCSSDFDPNSVSIEQAIDRILALATAIDNIETVALMDANKRVLSQDIFSPINVPPHRNSAMDGYALCIQDSTEFRTLKIVGKSLAGHPYTAALAAGEAARVMTGACIPDNANCVIMQEQTSTDGDQLHLQANVSLGQNIREAGSDIKQKLKLMTSGTLLGAAEIGLLASIGLSSVSVFAKPRVAIFSTGDELTLPGDPLKQGQIYDSNRFILASLLEALQVDIIDLGITADSVDALEKTFERAASADIVISTGGVSVGEADFVKAVLESLGQLHLWKVAMKPGRPLSVGQLNNGAIFFGLPGNPVSGMVTFALFVRPLINKIRSLPAQPIVELLATSQVQLRKMPGRVEYQRGILSQNEQGEYVVDTTGLQDSHVLSSMHKANCFIVLELESDGVASGDQVKVIRFTDIFS